MPRDFDREPLTASEMRVYLWLVREVKEGIVQAMDEAELLATKFRAAEIIAAHTKGDDGR